MSDSISALNLEAGQVVGGYTLVSRLGGGAMGTVWTVRDDAGQLFAMKILRDSLSEENELASHNSDERREEMTARERLRREALALSRVRHPGVASIVDMELDDALAFIVTERIDGDNLHDDVAKNGPYTGEDLELLTEKLSSAVEAVHQAGIIHRDIKPTNVMISATGPVLVDFGIAMGEGENHVTRTGLVMGTPGFIAPEVIEGAESDEETDWWSTASVLAFAATGKPVFGVKPIMAVLEREASGNADLSGLPARTRQAFQQALSPDRSQRITHRQLLQVLQQESLDSTFGGAGTGGGSGNAPGTADAIGGAASGAAAVMHPFEAKAANGADATGTLAAHAISPQMPAQQLPARQHGMRSLWTHHPDDTLTNTTDDEAETVALSGADVQGTQVLGNPMTPVTSVLPEAPKTSVTPVPEPTHVMPQGGLGNEEPQTSPTPLGQLRQPVPAVTSQPLEPAEEPTEMEDAETVPAVTPVVIPPLRQTFDAPDESREPYGQQYLPGTDAERPLYAPTFNDLVRERVGGNAGRLLAVILTVPIALMCACLPVAGAITGIVLLWLARSRGYSLHAQILRESKHGGKRKRRDGVVAVVSFPWHLLHGLLSCIPAAGVWTLGYIIVNLLGTTLTSSPTAMSGITLFSRSFTYSLLAGAPRAVGGIILGLTAAAAWLVCTCTGTAPTPALTGFASAWNSIKHGFTAVKSAGYDGDVNDFPSDAGTVGFRATPDPDNVMGMGRHSPLGILLGILLAAFVVAAVAAFLVMPSVDWSPLLLWES
ncbi:MAG: protein kinase [Bifidobacteriaceae bacterium]|nr:protein kinase [Bifidobacteriaceae bacterium]MCI1978494.1 protein kinase [Bifidobacteriaceae bacterium]